MTSPFDLKTLFARLDFSATMDPSQFVGRAPQQVEEFIAQIVHPIRQRYPQASSIQAEVNV